MLDRKQILYLKLILHKELSRTSFMITFITFMISLVFPTSPLMLMTQGKYFHQALMQFFKKQEGQRFL